MADSQFHQFLKQAAPEAVGAAGNENPVTAADLDLTPFGLNDAPAHQEDVESIVYTGNS